MLNILKDLYSTKEAVSIYTNQNDINKFHFGTVLAVNEREIAIHMISPDGEDDGIIAMDVNNIFRVEQKGQYKDKMEKLCSSNVFPAYDLEVTDGRIIEAVILLAFKEKAVLSIELLNSGFNDIVGFVEAIDSTECKILQVDEYGRADGVSHVFTDDITNVTVLSEDEKRIQRLWELNQ